MGSVVVVAMEPVCSYVSDLLQRIEDVAFQHLGAIRPIESFDIGVLRWLAWLDVIEGNSLGLGSLGQRMCNEFRAVVQTN
ncbi:hypothetical protein MCEMSHM24_02449 [Comamonadaceae bacterium]